MKVFRFTPALDIVLLKEVTAIEPWASGHGKVSARWAEIASLFWEGYIALQSDATENIPPSNIAPTGPAVQRRFNILLDTFQRNEMESLRASGVEEEHTERDQLLGDIFQMMEEFDSVKKEKTAKEKKKADEKEEKGQDIRFGSNG
ncbi:hypothetical protein HDU67_001360, partial [Dinochytrium kinnereticum]